MLPIVGGRKALAAAVPTNGKENALSEEEIGPERSKYVSSPTKATNSVTNQFAMRRNQSLWSSPFLKEEDTLVYDQFDEAGVVQALVPTPDSPIHCLFHSFY